ncbi:MAG: hypothetical protein Q9182_007442 [Xanthomendoza sp. 2 TL-2023]
MNAALVAALPGLAGNADLWTDEALVNAIWTGIFSSFFPTTSNPGTFLVCPEMIKGTVKESYVADLAIMQVSGAAPPTFRKPALCFEGKSSINPATWDKVEQQISDWTSKANIGMYGKIWGIGAKGSQFVIVAKDRTRDENWYFVSIGGAGPTFGNARVIYDITAAADIALLGPFLTFVTANPFPTIPRGIRDPLEATRMGPVAITHAGSDPYLKKIFALAQLHAALGSSREVFNADIIARGIKDETPTKKLTKDQFDFINTAITSVHLNSTEVVDGDQDVFDQTAMLAAMVNTRIAAINNEKNPNGYDITKAEDRLRMDNDAANGLFNSYNSQLGPFEVTKEFWTERQTHTYSTTTIQLDALGDLFASLALPEAELVKLLDTAKAFVNNMKNISLSIANKGVKNAKLINFIAVQAPVGNPDLAHVAVQRMIYIQFNQATSEWSTSCASHTNYTLDVTVFGMDVELNRQVVSLTYDHARKLICKDADITLDHLGSSGAGDVKNIQSNKAQPIGPAPINNG